MDEETKPCSCPNTHNKKVAGPRFKARADPMAFSHYTLSPFVSLCTCFTVSKIGLKQSCED